METLKACALCEGDRLTDFLPDEYIVRCSTCGLVFDSPRPTREEISRFYSQKGLYSDWLAEIPGRDALWRRRLNIVRSFKTGGDLLDVGAGIGQFLHFAQPWFRVEGTEISSEAAAIAKEHYGISLNAAEPEQYEEQGREFDVITLFHTLEHLPYPGRLIATCHRLLRPGGVLVIAVPNELGLTRASVKRRLAAKLNRLGLRSRPLPPGLQRISLSSDDNREIHLTHFTPQVLAAALVRAHFRVLLRSVDPYYTSTGFKLLYRSIDFAAWRAITKLTGRNFYETILIVAGKS